MFLPDQDIQAICYLYKEGDEKNKVFLTADKLYVVHKKRTFEFELENIKGFGFNIRKLMAPLITGGIMTSLSLATIFRNVFNPYVVTFTFLAGLLLFYYGWTGQLFFTVTTRIKDYDFSVPGASDNMKAFISFLMTSGLIGKKAPGRTATFFVALEKEIWEKYKDGSGIVPLPAEKRRLYTRNQVRDQKYEKIVFIEIDPLKTRNGVRYLKDPATGKLLPFLMGDLNREAIVGLEAKG